MQPKRSCYASTNNVATAQSFDSLGADRGVGCPLRLSAAPYTGAAATACRTPRVQVPSRPHGLSKGAAPPLFPENNFERFRGLDCVGQGSRGDPSNTGGPTGRPCPAIRLLRGGGIAQPLAWRQSSQIKSETGGAGTTFGVAALPRSPIGRQSADTTGLG